MPTWPSGSKAGTTNVDNPNDLVANARADIKQNFDNVNDITIPSNTYNFLLHLFKNEEKVYTHEFFTSQPIIQNSSITSKKYEVAVLPTDFNEYFSEIILKKEFLNNYIISNPEKSMRKLNEIWDLQVEWLFRRQINIIIVIYFLPEK